jgi:hypothetical protein
VDNTNGLLVNFQLVGTQVGSQSVSPSLTANLGDIASGTNAVAAWWMTASLQGQFTNYTASFTHLDDLGNGNLSLVQSISNHALVHVVRADVPDDDFVPDFLASDGYLTNTLPDSLYLSDGSVVSVSSITNGTIDGPPVPGHTNVLLTASLPPGWSYLRIPDPAPGVPLTFVQRSDGRFLLLGWNVWTTYRIVHPIGSDPYVESYLHLIDDNSTGSYTLGYNVSLYFVRQPQDQTNVVGTTATFTVEAGGNQPFSYQWRKGQTDLPGQTNATLTIANVQVFDQGEYSVIVSNLWGVLPSASAWLEVLVPPEITVQPQNSTNLVGTWATFTVEASGTLPFSYQWMKNDMPLPDGTNSVLDIPSVQTNDAGLYRVWIGNVAGSTNSATALLKVPVPPTIWPVPDQEVTVGARLVITNHAEDPDEPIVFSLGTNAPAGASMTTNGIFTWTPACYQGNSSYTTMVWAADSDVPPTSNSITFILTVPECIEASLGRTSMAAGDSNWVTLNLLSTVELTNLSLTVVYPPERFTNLWVWVDTNQVSPPYTTNLPGGHYLISFDLPADQILHGPTNVGELWLMAVPDQASAFVPLLVTNVVGFKPDGTNAANAYGYPGRVVVVGQEPLLEALHSTTNEVLLFLYSQTNATCTLETTTNILLAPEWLHVMTFNPTNLETHVTWTNQGEPARFFRLKAE